MLVRTPPPRGHQRRPAGLRRRRARGARRGAGRLPPCAAAIVAAVAARAGRRRRRPAQGRSSRRRPEWLRIVRDVDDATEIDRATGAVRSVQSAEVVLPRRADRRAVVAAVPRAPRAHLLALPHARDARPRPRLLHRGRALRLPALPAAEAADLPGARVRDGRPRAGSCAGASSAGCSSPAAGAAATATWRSTSSAGPADQPGHGQRRRRGRGGELLPGRSRRA